MRFAANGGCVGGSVSSPSLANQDRRDTCLRHVSGENTCWATYAQRCRGDSDSAQNDFRVAEKHIGLAIKVAEGLRGNFVKAYVRPNGDNARMGGQRASRGYGMARWLTPWQHLVWLACVQGGPECDAVLRVRREGRDPRIRGRPRQARDRHVDERSKIPYPFSARPPQEGLWVDCATTQRQGLQQTLLIYFLFLARDVQMSLVSSRRLCRTVSRFVPIMTENAFA
jgi:hypothetical protein